MAPVRRPEKEREWGDELVPCGTDGTISSLEEEGLGDALESLASMPASAFFR
jgi:hypothetical protein